MALKQVLAFFSYKVEGADDLDKADKKTTALTSSTKALGGVLAGIGTAAAVKGLFSFVNGAADAADATDKFATAIGTSARNVAEWDQILGNAGVGLQSGRKGLQAFTKASGSAAEGNKGLRATFRKLGVSAKDSSGQLRPFNDRLTDTVLGLTKIENPAQRAATAQKLFGKAGLGFVRIALDGADALQTQRQEFEDLFGGGAYEKFTEDSKKAALANDRWRNATGALKATIASALVPALTSVVVVIAKVTRTIAKLVAGTKIVQVSLTVLGVAFGILAVKVLIAFAPVILTFGLIALGLGAIILLVEDLYQLFTGGESLIGRWLDQWLGATKAQILVESIKESVIDLGKFVVSLADVGKVALEILRAAFQQTADEVERIVEFVKDSVELAERVIGNLSDLGGTFLGRGDATEESLAESARQFGFSVPQAPAPAPALPAVAPRLADAQRSTVTAGGSSAVTVNSPTQITVQGSGDPEATARKVLEAMDAREQDTLRQVRSLATAR